MLPELFFFIFYNKSLLHQTAQNPIGFMVLNNQKQLKYFVK